MIDKLLICLERVMMKILLDPFFWGDSRPEPKKELVNTVLWEVNVGQELLRSLNLLVSREGVGDQFSVIGGRKTYGYCIQVFAGNQEVMRVKISYPDQFLPMIIRDGEVHGQPFHYCKNSKELHESAEELLSYIIWRYDRNLV